MLQVNITILKVSAERFLTDIPPQPIHIGISVNILTAESKGESKLEIPFLLSVNYNPPIASINVQGRAIVTGDRDEVRKVHGDCQKDKGPPQAIAQTISNVAIVEALLLARSLNVPPPIPLPQIQEPKREGKVDYRI